jgi:putative ABC transport system permease protein
MWFLTFVFKNISRRPLRSALTALSMAIGVGAVVSLVGISSRFQHKFIELYESVKIDLIVFKKGGVHRADSELDASLEPKMRAIRGVKDVLPGLNDTVSFDDYGMPIVPVIGLVPGSPVFDHYRIRQGRVLAPGDVRGAIIGSDLAYNSKKSVGDTIALMEDEFFEIVGVFDSEMFSENSAVVVRLEDLQKLMDKEDKVTGYSIITEHPEDPAELARIRQAIVALDHNMDAKSPKEHVNSLTEVKLAGNMSWLTSAIALIIGAVGMINTMVMSVHERVGEIGILRAIGWRKRRVVLMIINEAVVLSLIGAVVGALGAVLLVRLLTNLPMAQTLIDGRIDLPVIFQGIAIALVVGLLGGILPAMKAARLQPTTALRYE